MGIAWKSSTEQ
jgi:hypothetical protein